MAQSERLSAWVAFAFVIEVAVQFSTALDYTFFFLTALVCCGRSCILWRNNREYETCSSVSLRLKNSDRYAENTVAKWDYMVI